MGTNVRDMSHSSPAAQARPSRKKITKAREAAGLSKAELARRIGVSRSLITEIENGTRNATEETLAKIASELGRDPAALSA